MKRRTNLTRHPNRTTPSPRTWITWALICAFAVPLMAVEKRAKPPKFEGDALGNVFYSDLSAAVRESRPSAPQLHGAATQAATQELAGGPSSAAETEAAAGTGWSALISPVSLEDEIKRLKLHYDGVVTTPGPFKSGGYQDARLDLSVLATLFAVISEYEANVRWKEEAAAARDLLARTAFNSKAGSVQVYNEAKLRKADLQDLVAGSGLSSRDAEEGNDWSMIVDRTPLMEYLDWAQHEQLSPNSNNKAAVEEHAELLRRNAETIAVVGRVLTQEGMDDADDADYRQLSEAMTKAALDVRTALDKKDADAVRTAVAAVGQSCMACHEQFR